MVIELVTETGELVCADLVAMTERGREGPGADRRVALVAGSPRWYAPARSFS